MCRLFGFRSVINSQVHSSLVHAENALSSQSVRHPDGWGVAYYLEQTPHLIKSTECAFDDHIFHKVSGVVSSHTVLAHIRKATQGSLNILNSHPFQYGKWVFAHNGNLKNFSTYKLKLMEKISDKFKRFVLGSTDSEIIFYLLLTFLEDEHQLDDPNIEASAMTRVTQKLCDTITKLSGPLHGGHESCPTETHLTFIITSGEAMYAFQGGQPLHFSTHKSLCSEKDNCPYFDNSCETKAASGEKINHLIFSSEKLLGENIWTQMNNGVLLGVDQNMTLTLSNIKVEFTQD